MALDHTPPDHALDAEDMLISECLANTELVESLGLSPREFFNPSSKILWEAAADFRARGESSVPVEALVDHLHRKGRLADVGGKAGVARAVGAVPSTPDVAPLAQIVKEAAQIRALDATLTKLQARCRGAVGDRAALLAEARAAVEAVTEGTGRKGRGLLVADAADVPEQLPPIAYLCQAIHLAPGRPLFLSGYSNVGKTMLVVDLLLAISSLEQSGVTCWGGLTVQRHGRALMVDCEQGTYLTQLRLKRLAAGRWGDLRQWAGRLSYVCFPSFSLTQPDAEAVLTETLQGYVVAAFDSLTALTPGLDENGKEISEPIALLTRVSEKTGCAIIVLHHEGKPPAEGPREARFRMRGHSSIQGGAGSHWAVSSLGEGKLQLEHGKSHWGSLQPPIFCQIADVGERGEDGMFPGVRLAPAGPVGAEPGPIDAPAPGTLQKLKRTILAVLGAMGELTSNELHQELKKSGLKVATDTRFNTVKEMKDAGEIVCERRGKALAYRLPGTITSIPSLPGNRSAGAHPSEVDGERLPLDSLPPR